jgi:DNA replication protein DnaC
MSDPQPLSNVVAMWKPGTSANRPGWDRPEPAKGPPHVPVRYRHRLADLEQTRAVNDTLAWLGRYQPGCGLLLLGPVGAGKSTIAGALALHFGAPNHASYWPVADMIDAMKREMDDPPQGHSVRVKIDKRPVLVLDDLGTELDTAWQTKAVTDLIAHRYDQQLTLVATTNLTVRQLGDRFGERTLSRLHEMCELVTVGGNDRRRS